MSFVLSVCASEVMGQENSTAILCWWISEYVVIEPYWLERHSPWPDLLLLDSVSYKIFIYWYFWAINSLALGRFKVNFKWVIFKLTLVVNGWGISCDTALIWTSLDHTYNKSAFVQVMAWCRQATSHYLSQCWPRSLSPYGITRPQWVNCIAFTVNA